MDYQLERAQDVFKEIIPLLEKHWTEIAFHRDIKLDPNYEKYFQMQDAGLLRVYTVRNEGVLVGYSVFFLNYNLHYQTSYQALQDILFIHPEFRGAGVKFILWCDQQLKAEKVQIVYQHIKEKHNFGPMLERIGYELVDLIYARRLDKWGQ